MSSSRTFGLGALFLDPGVSGGTETYLRGLVPALITARPSIRFELATTRRGATALAEEPWAGDLRLIRVPCDDDEPARRTLFELVGLPSLARRRGWDLLHTLSNRGPRRMPCPHVVTVHDVTFFHHATLGAISDRGMRWAVAGAVRGADAVITGSTAAADDVGRTLGLERGKITSVPHGAGRPKATPSDSEDTRGRYRLGGARVVLCVAAKRPHKNQALLINALPDLPEDVALVLVGHDEGYGSELEALARARRLTERVRLVNYASDSELEALWALAGCAAFPTRAEGFGLPVLEAMTRGIPVACSDIPVLREVAGDVARYFDPDEAGEAASAVAACLAEERPVRAACERAALFSWDRAAEETLQVYARALAFTRCT